MFVSMQGVGGGRVCVEETTGCRILKIALRTENLGNYSKVEDRVSRGIRFLITLNYDQIFPEAGVDREGSLSTRSQRWSLPLPRVAWATHARVQDGVLTKGII